ncbi:MAG: hypothetical protein A2Y38_06585 [Spirochaetes bacterium GWB1_59_5]|nr:MAG: hypothetical protein A2Y38_06585 [Spirochaetes bacterium GWB1_59_5]
MTVKVVGHSPKVEQQVTCPGCGAILSYVPNDVKEVWESDGEGGQELRRFIPCPGCHKQVTLRNY